MVGCWQGAEDNRPQNFDLPQRQNRQDHQRRWRFENRRSGLRQAQLTRLAAIPGRLVFVLAGLGSRMPIVMAAVMLGRRDRIGVVVVAIISWAASVVMATGGRMSILMSTRRGGGRHTAAHKASRRLRTRGAVNHHVRKPHRRKGDWKLSKTAHSLQNIGHHSLVVGGTN